MKDMKLLEIDPNSNGLVISQNEGYISTTWNATSNWFNQAKCSTTTLAPLVVDVPSRALNIKDKLIKSVDTVGYTLPDVVSPVSKFVKTIFD
jgi:isopropylmalate/homocitrate/citramalate synthase